MSRAQRLGIVVVAVVFAVAAFVLFKPDDEQTTTREPTAAPQRNAAPRETQAAKPARPPQPRTTRVQVRGGEPVGGVKKITTRKGEVVRLTAVSNVADEVHVHGYDISRPVGPGKVARFRFEAAIEGVFEIELEGRGVEIARLEVSP